MRPGRLWEREFGKFKGINMKIRIHWLKSRKSKLLPWGSLAVALVALGGAGPAQADWKVKDETLIKDSKDQWKTENEQRDSLRRIGAYQSAGEKLEEPKDDEVLPKDRPSETVDLDVSKRCKEPDKKEGVAGQQYNLCQEIVKTERAQYTYSMKVYENTKKRYEAFDRIQKEREKIGENDAGKLADNTNKLLALLTLMEIDKQQHDTYMAAYSARLHYLNKSVEELTRQTIGGDPGAKKSFGADLAGRAAGLATLALALDALKTENRYNP